MKNIILSLPIYFFAIFAISSLSSCSAEETKSPKRTIQLKSRAFNDEAYPKAFRFKTIASFARGNIIGAAPNNLNDKEVSLAVTYDSDTPWAEIFKTGKIDQTGSYQFNQIINANKLAIRHQFQVDGYNECLIIDFTEDSKDLEMVCKEISSIDHVVVVHVKEWPTLKNANSNTAASD